MRAWFSLGILVALLPTQPLFPQENSPLLGRILQAEDHRARGTGELEVLLRGLSAGEPLVVRRAARALGRLERSELAARLFPLLEHADPALRVTAALAVAQAAQGYRADSSAPRGSAWPALLGALGARVSAERDPAVRGAVALALGRLPYATPEEIDRAAAWILELGAGLPDAALLDAVRGLEFLIRLTGRRVAPSEPVLSRLRALAGAASSEPRIRRLALTALLGARAGDPATLADALQSGDPQLRRLALSGIARLPAREPAQRLLRAGLVDSVASVRYEALGGLARVLGAGSCPAVVAAAGDRDPGVSLLALDLLGGACPGVPAAARTLSEVLGRSSRDWHPRAHALLSLARVEPARAAVALPLLLGARVWQLRMYGARAAAVLRDTTALRRLALDRVANVREAALSGLRAVSGHADDARYRAALAASDGQLVLTAAQSLAGSPAPKEAARALLNALARITAERRETSRDPRLSILVRLRELGEPSLAPALTPYLRDFDPAVADSAAALLTAWTGTLRVAAPRRPYPATVSFAAVEALRGKRLRFTMASGGTFEVLLLVDDAPVTVLRVARLAARGYYDGLSFHRVVPNFVLQGGSPGANEYAGDGPFMRDELGGLSHERGTLGISTRGRDTGDGQLFLNLVDNPRLDFEYTVWGRVLSGMAVVDAVLEGDIIARVEIRSR